MFFGKKLSDKNVFGLFSYQSMVLQLASAKNSEKNARCVIRISDVGYLKLDFLVSKLNIEKKLGYKLELNRIYSRKIVVPKSY
jgi:hypothetical protein